MTIKDLKDLQQVIKTCRKLGVQSIRIDNVEFHLGSLPAAAPKAKQAKRQTRVLDNPGIITEDTQIETDGLTEEQMLFYSSDMAASQDQQ